MILSNNDIQAEIERGGLGFYPSVNPNLMSPSSIDLRLGDTFTVPRVPPAGVSIHIDPMITSPEDALRKYSDIVKVGRGEKFALEPGAFVLGYTLERVELSNYLAARVEGRSSIARWGISIHQTAPTVQAGFSGQLRLEIANLGPYTILLEPGMPFCQLIVERLSSPASSARESRWHGQGSGRPAG